MTEEPASEGRGRVFEPSPFPHWSYSSAGVEIRFGGRRSGQRASEPADALTALSGPTRVSWLRQRHSAVARAAADGPCGEGDGLWTTEPGLALCVATADCVPIVCGDRHRLAVIHAGWRGLVAGVIEATVSALPQPTGEIDAWLGPAIGPCCYEVGEDVAASVSASSSSKIASQGRSGRPYLDLHLAAEVQLRNLGIARVHRVAECTKCHPDVLWSYRGTQGRRGRNLTFAWLTAASADAASSAWDRSRDRVGWKDLGRRS